MKKAFGLFLKILSGLCGIALLVFCALFLLLPLPGSPTVLMYHFVGTEQDARQGNNYISGRMLAEELEFLKRFGYRVISMNDYRDILLGRKKSMGREVLITFDDGNYSFFTVALPILERYQFPVTVFLVTDYVEKNMGGSITPSMIRELLRRKWFQIGVHSKTHSVLTEVDDRQLREETEGARIDLENRFGVPVRYFAYPAGIFDERVMKAVQNAGYDMAFTTSPKRLGNFPSGRYSIMRTKISRDCDYILSWWVHVSGIYQSFKRWRQQTK